MAYNKRLKITQADYNRLESILDEAINHPNVHVWAYVKAAKQDGYSKTRILFDIYHGVCAFLQSEKRIDEHTFIRDLTRRDYLNDASLESALSAILSSRFDLQNIGANLYTG